MRSTLISLHQIPTQQLNEATKQRKNLRPLVGSFSLTAMCVLPILISSAAKAQAPAPPDANLPIPADIANNGSAAMQSLLTPRVDIEFQDISVTDLLIQIAKLGGVEIAIRGDVGGILKFVRYKNVTAEDAIERVSDDAGLFWGKRGDQYVVARILEDLPYELQIKYRNGAKTSGNFNGNLPKSGGSVVAENPFPPPPLGTPSGIELINGSNGTERLPNSNNFSGIPELYNKEAAKKRDKSTNVIKIKNVTARMIAHWLDPSNTPPDYWTENSDRARAQASDTRTLVPAGSLQDYGLLNSAYGNQQTSGSSYPYPYPNGGQYPQYPANNGYGAMPYGSLPYGGAPYGAPGYGSYVASPYVMQGMSNGQPIYSYNVPTAFGMQRGAQGDISTYFNRIQGQDLQATSSWTTSVTNSNPWGQRPIMNPWIQASPQFGGRNNNNNNNNNNGRNGRGNNGGIGGGGNNQNSGVFELPEGIDSMVAIDAQNSLLVRGTAEAVEELQQLIELIDQPLKQVEIEAQFVSLTNANSKFFAINFNGSALPFTITGTTNTVPATSGNFNIGFVNKNFQATLASLVTNNRAKIVTAPRVVAINNLTASLQSQTVTTVLLSQAAINAGNNNNNVVATAQVPFQIRTSIGITVAPTINGDGTITVLLQPQVQQQGIPTNANPIPQVTAQTVQTVAIVRDGDTIALGGLRNKAVQNTKQRIPFLGSIPILGKLFQRLDKSDRDEDLIIFLTARVIHRLDDAQAIPGT